MKSLYIIKIIIVLVLITSCSALRKDSWPEKMQELSMTLVDVFPFFYTKMEYKDPKNESLIKEKIKSLKESVHGIPFKEGQVFIGAEPLIEEFPKILVHHFDEATRLYDIKEFTKSRSHIRQAIQQCGACHTSHRVGPSVEKVNLEVFNIYANTQDKVEVLMAIRQYEGALNLIETYFKNRKYKLSFQIAETLLKYHLVISARTLKNYQRSRLFLQTYAKKNSSGKIIIKSWIKSLTQWGSEKDVFNKSDSPQAFVYNLAKTDTLHHSVLTGKGKSDLRKTYNGLANAYGNMKLEAFSIFPSLYLKACTKLQKEVGGKCEKK